MGAMRQMCQVAEGKALPVLLCPAILCNALLNHTGRLCQVCLACVQGSAKVGAVLSCLATLQQQSKVQEC